MSEQEYAPNEVDRLAQIIRTADGNHDMGAGALAEAIADSGLLYDIRADERAKALDDHKCDEQAERAYRRAVTAEQALRDERAKRPDREQLEEMAHDWADNADGTIDPAAHRSFLAGVDAVLASLALEPEAREVTDAEAEAAAVAMHAAAVARGSDLPGSVVRWEYKNDARVALEAAAKAR